MAARPGPRPGRKGRADAGPPNRSRPPSDRDRQKENSPMANWKRIAKVALLGDGHISTKETDILKAEILANKDVSHEELEFLAELKKDAKTVVKVFDEFFHEAIKLAVLDNGVISEAEAKLLRKIVFADGKVSPTEKALIAELKKGAKKTHPDFDKLADEVAKA
jgi:uncharacterized tellurite resistance protein B-like protein